MMFCLSSDLYLLAQDLSHCVTPIKTLVQLMISFNQNQIYRIDFYIQMVKMRLPRVVSNGKGQQIKSMLSIMTLKKKNSHCETCTMWLLEYIHISLLMHDLKAIITRFISDQDHSTGKQNYHPIQALKGSTFSRLSCMKRNSQEPSFKRWEAYL